MNYLAHAAGHLGDAYFVAGTALPDWMHVVDRKNRPRRAYAVEVVDDADPRVARLAQGCVRHHDDDGWFHANARFVDLSTRLAIELRGLMGADQSHQAGFTGHVLVELLLDSVLCERDSTLLPRYYALLRSLDPDAVQDSASRICRRPVLGLADLIPKFIDSNFLADYATDQGLMFRMNGLMRRVGLPQLPPAVLPWLSSARERVRLHADEMLQP